MNRRVSAAKQSMQRPWFGSKGLRQKIVILAKLSRLYQNEQGRLAEFEDPGALNVAEQQFKRKLDKQEKKYTMMRSLCVILYCT